MAIPLPPGGAVWPWSRWSAFLPGVPGQRCPAPDAAKPQAAPWDRPSAGKRPLALTSALVALLARYFGSGAALASSRSLLRGDPECGWGTAPLTVGVGAGAFLDVPVAWPALGERLCGRATGGGVDKAF